MSWEAWLTVSGVLSCFALMAATYYWLPKFSGNMYSEKWGKIHFWLSAISVNILFFPQHYLGLAGMPRRIPDYSTQFADFNMISSIGGFIFGASQLVFVGVVIHCVYKSRQAATDRVWDGAKGLEWTVPSPAPYHTFDEPPKLAPSAVAARATTFGSSPKSGTTKSAASATVSLRRVHTSMMRVSSVGKRKLGRKSHQIIEESSIRPAF